MPQRHPKDIYVQDGYLISHSEVEPISVAPDGTLMQSGCRVLGIRLDPDHSDGFWREYVLRHGITGAIALVLELNR